MLAATIGNFDGVHLGHVALVTAARRHVGQAGRVVAVTFEPHPVARLRPEAAPPRLTSPAERRRLLAEAGADEVVELEPTRELLGLGPEEFTRTLRERIPFTAIVEGDDFRFGRGRSGSLDTMRGLGRTMGFEAIEVGEVDVPLCDQTLVRASSSIVRWLLARGRVVDAMCVLGRPYEIVSVTVPGDRRGRTIGFPTLNCGPIEQMLPMDGVYGGIATLPPTPAGPRQAIAAISIGTKPTFHGDAAPRTCEAYLLDTTLPLDWYGVPIRLALTTWIREQRTFAGLDGLLERIRADVEEIRRRAPEAVGRRPVEAMA